MSEELKIVVGVLAFGVGIGIIFYLFREAKKFMDEPIFKGSKDLGDDIEKFGEMITAVRDMKDADKIDKAERAARVGRAIAATKNPSGDTELAEILKKNKR